MCDVDVPAYGQRREYEGIEKEIITFARDAVMYSRRRHVESHPKASLCGVTWSHLRRLPLTKLAQIAMQG